MDGLVNKLITIGGAIALLGAAFFWWGQIDGRVAGVETARASQQEVLGVVSNRLNNLENQTGIIQYRIEQLDQSQQEIKRLIKEIPR